MHKFFHLLFENGVSFCTNWWWTKIKVFEQLQIFLWCKFNCSYNALLGVRARFLSRSPVINMTPPIRSAIRRTPPTTTPTRTSVDNGSDVTVSTDVVMVGNVCRDLETESSSVLCSIECGRQWCEEGDSGKTKAPQLMSAIININIETCACTLEFHCCKYYKMYQLTWAVMEVRF